MRLEAKATAAKIRLVESETTIKYIEEDIMRSEQQIKDLTAAKDEKASQKLADWQEIKKRVRYLLEHLSELLLQQADPVKKAQFFGALFNKLPNYEELGGGTPKKLPFTGINPIFALAKMSKIQMVTPAGFEPAIFRLRT